MENLYADDKLLSAEITASCREERAQSQHSEDGSPGQFEGSDTKQNEGDGQPRMMRC